MRDGFPLAIGLALANTVVLVIARIKPPFVIDLEAIGSALFAEVYNRLEWARGRNTSA